MLRCSETLADYVNKRIKLVFSKLSYIPSNLIFRSNFALKQKDSVNQRLCFVIINRRKLIVILANVYGFDEVHSLNSTLNIILKSYVIVTLTRLLTESSI